MLRVVDVAFAADVSTHSRLKAAEVVNLIVMHKIVVSTHSRLKAADNIGTSLKFPLLFQHTAA